MIEKYRDILHRPHHRSPTHPPMSLWDRAAQFAPFSALSGHAEGAAEAARSTSQRIQLTDDAIAQLEGRMDLLAEHLEEHPTIAITYFVPDRRKEGGDYVTTLGRLKKIDGYRHLLVLTNQQEIPISDIVSLEGEIFDALSTHQ